jgi:hypothetical protein
MAIPDYPVGLPTRRRLLQSNQARSIWAKQDNALNSGSPTCALQRAALEPPRPEQSHGTE